MFTFNRNQTHRRRYNYKHDRRVKVAQPMHQYGRRTTMPCFEKTRLFCIVPVFVMAACSGGEDDSSGGIDNTPLPPPPLPSVQTGVFKDLNVAGLAFVSGGESGITDNRGRFTCETGSDVAFSIGTANLGSTACTTLVTPNQLATDGPNFDLELANLARFLQMLDSDDEPDNGIVISEAVQQIAASWAPIDFLTSDLTTELSSVISDVASVDLRTPQLPSEQDALAHLNATLDCAYAGAYAGSIAGSSSGAAGMVIGWQAPSFGFLPRAFEWQGFDAVNEVGVFGGGGPIEIRGLPIIDHTDPGVAGPISAQFVTADSIAGTWEGGALNLRRIGPADDGSRFRLVGKAENFAFDAQVQAYMSLNLDGEAIAGEAFEVLEGTVFTVVGELVGDNVVLTATSGGQTLLGSGVMTRHPDGSPNEAQGTFDDGTSFSIVACRLN